MIGPQRSSRRFVQEINPDTRRESKQLWRLNTQIRLLLCSVYWMDIRGIYSFTQRHQVCRFYNILFHLVAEYKLQKRVSLINRNDVQIVSYFTPFISVVCKTPFKYLSYFLRGFFTGTLVDRYIYSSGLSFSAPDFGERNGKDTRRAEFWNLGTRSFNFM
jgi:hypothetical protein